MKSKLINLYNYIYLIPESISEDISLEDIRGDVEHECHNLRFQSKKMIQVPIVNEKDSVSLNLKSELKKFNRNHLKLNVGSHFFSKELETFLIGKEVGEEYECIIDGNSVHVFIEECIHTSIPEFNDALIQEQGIEHVNTVEEFKNYTLQKYKDFFHEYYVEYLAMQYFDKWIEKSKWEIDEEELNEWCDAMNALQEEEMEFHNVVYAENYPGELQEENLRLANIYLKASLIDCFLNGLDPNNYQINLKSMTEINEIATRVHKPLKNYIRPRFTINWKEEE